ncbi:ultraviolet-B receptor UVR8-like isoform X2 [Chenopodium quinoa]|uniref:ultraviolet-B receptor UVR8-like isoform X2 n=1 Tax=Chenopodium quinoa TaxID=63459 RepID=UPI000B77513E|nr:ultraviolet-B receptor UVR8-like isoform X2 [Chenopodium quinoa]
MNGGEGEGGGSEMQMEVEMGEEERERRVYMWGYLPGALPQRTPLQSPIIVKLPPSIGTFWKDVCGGGCGFAMAISDTGKLITWGSTDDLGQSYVTSGKHGETPEAFPLPTEAPIVRAAAGWAHCVSITDGGEVYTWGWKECVPSGKVFGDSSSGGGLEKEALEKSSSMFPEQVSPRGSKNASGSGLGTGFDNKGAGEETAKRRRVSSAKQAAESSTTSEETLSALPCLVTLSPGVRISTVAAGGRHTLALSDVGQVWGWGYGGEGQLGLGSRIRMVSSPHPVPCIESSYRKDGHSGFSQGGLNSDGHGFRVPGSYIKGIACGGRHSAAITDAGAILAFGWGLYGQCGQGATDDVLSPTCVSSLLGIRIEAAAAGLWHTLCKSTEGDVYAFGGNQFGQLGTGSDQAETLPRLLDAPSIESVNAKIVSCGARHSAIVTEDGKVFCWGWNKYGQLGLGDAIDRNIPSQVKIDGCVAKNVACGWWHTLLLAESPT